MFERKRTKRNKQLRRMERARRYSESERSRQRIIRERKTREMEGLLKIFIGAACLLLVVLILAKAGVFQKAAQVAKKRVSTPPPVVTEAPVVESPEVETAQVATGTSIVMDPEPKKEARPKAVALTFDDGPSRENTETILNVLSEYQAHATFFVVGNRVPVDKDILQKELQGHHEIENHSYDHSNLARLKWKKVKAQMKKTDALVKEATGGYKMSYLRPPYGAISDKMRKDLDRPMILWSLDTLDWKTDKPGKVFKAVKKNVKDGDIILMHDIHSSTAEAVKKIVPWLASQGYDMLTVKELFERKNLQPKNGGAYD